jgi:hypothetical protein
MSIENEMFDAAQREELFGYDFCRERGIGQQAVWNALHDKEEEFLGGCNED